MEFLFNATLTVVMGLTSSMFQAAAEKGGVDPVILEGICRYESDSGRIKHHHNRNGTWDVGYCQNHRGKSEERPPIPSDRASMKEAVKELKYWEKQHNRFCVKMVQEEGTCGKVIYGKWRGVKNCHRPHHWFHHYNSGFRVLKNNYGDKVYCFIKNGFKKCKESQWRKLRRETFGN